MDLNLFYKYRSVAYFIILFLLLTNQTKAQSADVNFKNCKKCIVLAEQSVNRIAILDLNKKAIVWEWVPASAIKADHLKWFNYPSEAKPVYGGKYILTTASGGAVTLIRIADKKVMFYAFAGGNTHSAEILPDGNIVSASSTGNFLTVFHVDTLKQPEQVYKKNIWLANGHNVVWDKKRKLLWTASNEQLKSFIYNFNFEKPDLIVKDSVTLEGTDSHDLFPVYGQQSLWVTNPKGLYQYDPGIKKLQKIPVKYPDIKSVSNGTKRYPTLLIYAKNTQKAWWTDEITSLDYKIIFKQSGLQIYKARWFIQNKFSY